MSERSDTTGSTAESPTATPQTATTLAGEPKANAHPESAPAAIPEPTTPKEGRGIHLSERAAKEIKRVLSEQNFPDTTWVRIGAKGGGCSGFSYVLDFDKSGPTEFDLGFVMHGVRYCVDKKSEFFMGGTTLDFNDGLLDRGFVFQNPQAKGTCGCGTSFSA